MRRCVAVLLLSVLSVGCATACPINRTPQAKAIRVAEAALAPETNPDIRRHSGVRRTDDGWEVIVRRYTGQGSGRVYSPDTTTVLIDKDWRVTRIVGAD